ncbi:MAG: ribonuclease Y [Thermodesulfobacteriota bacterium]
MDIYTGIILAVTAVIAILVGLGVGFALRKKIVEANVKASGSMAESIVAEAKKEAENTRKEAALQAKDIVLQGKSERDKETQERQKELHAQERRIQNKEENLDKKYDAAERREKEISKRERFVEKQEKHVKDLEGEMESLIERERDKLEGLSGMSAEEAKNMLLLEMEQKARHEAGKTLKKIEEELTAESDKKAKNIIALAIQKYAGEYVAEKTVSVVNLPNDEMKGRIIGREGRNIRAIEAATGIDVIIDDTPEAVILSGHNPVRREIARQSLERLISDGRIHPSRVEDIVAKVEKEVNKSMIEAGESAVFDTGLHGIHKEVQKLVGRLKYRTSYTQNVYAHSMEVAFICGIMAAELGLSVKMAKRAGLLHDIGKAVDHEVEGPHAAIGAELAKRFGEAPKIVSAIASHHNDTQPTILGVLVQAADTLSAARPGARRERLENYVKRIDEIEGIARDFPGVDKCYAIQAGREIRVMVGNKTVSDDDAVLLSKDIAQKIEKELSYPGQIKITVIRESRAVEYAR